MVAVGQNVASPVLSSIFVGPVVQRLYLVVGPLLKNFLLWLGLPCMDSHITVEPLIKDALRQGH